LRFLVNFFEGGTWFFLLNQKLKNIKNSKISNLNEGANSLCGEGFDGSTFEPNPEFFEFRNQKFLLNQKLAEEVLVIRLQGVEVAHKAETKLNNL